MQVAILIARWVLAVAALAASVALFRRGVCLFREGKESRILWTPLYFLAVIVGIVGLILLPLGSWEVRGGVAFLFVLPETSLLLVLGSRLLTKGD